MSDLERLHSFYAPSSAKRARTEVEQPGAEAALESTVLAEPSGLTLEQARQLRQLLDERPEQVLALAVRVWDAELTLPQLRDRLDRAIVALEAPAEALVQLESLEAMSAAANPLPADFTFPGMDLQAIPIDPGDHRFETLGDLGGWLIRSGPQFLGGLLGTTKKAPFRWHGQADELVYPLPPLPFELALYGDFGSGRYFARYIARHLAAHPCPVALHLGDVYYSGRADEFREYMEEPLRPMFGKTQLWFLNSNHEMLSGARHYFTFLDGLRNTHGGVQRQTASYFCLRNDRLQIVAMDTDYFDDGRLRRKRPEGRRLHEWLEARLTEGRALNLVTVLLTANEPYSHGSSSSTSLYKSDLAAYAHRGLIDLWFWGNTHYNALFGPSSEFPFIGSCVGHAGYPYETQKLKPSGVRPVFLETATRFPGVHNLRTDMGRNGYCRLALDANGTLTLRFVDWMTNVRALASIQAAPGASVIQSVTEDKLSV